METDRNSTSLGILGLAHYLPGEPVTNETVARTSGLDIEWIRERTGIETRHHAPPEMQTSDLAVRAGQRALEAAPTGPDMIVLGTGTPDRPAPATACYVQQKMGLTGVPAFDTNAGCSGFIYSLATGAGMVHAGAAQYPLVIVSDTFTRCIDPKDRRTAPLFGDGAAAALLGPVPDGYGILAVELWADGSRSEAATMPTSDSYFQMDGRSVKDVVMEMGPKILNSALAKAGVRLEQLNRVIVHQANPKLVRWLGDSVGLSPEVVPDPGRLTGNTATASVAVAFSMVHAERPLRDGDLFALVTVGAGMTAAAAVMRWYEPSATS